MSLIARPRWTRQPNGVVAVDPAIGRRLALLYRAQTAEQIKPSTVTVEVAAAQTVVSGVVAAGTTIVRRYPTTGLQPTTAVTVLAVVNLATSSANNERIFGAVEALVFPYQGYTLQRYPTGKVGFGVGDSSSLITEIVEPTAVLGLHTYIGTFDSANVNLYRDGVLIASTARATGISYTGNGIPVLGGYWNGSSTVTNEYLRGNVVMIGVWSERALPAPLARSLSANPWQIFKPVTRTIGAVISGVTISRPSSDVTTTGWSASSGAILYDMIDEVTPSDTDYIVSPSLSGSPGPAVFGITPTQASGTYNVRLRSRRTGASGDIRALLLDSVGSTVGTSAWQALTGSYTQYTLSVTTTGTAERVQLEVRA